MPASGGTAGGGAVSDPPPVWLGLLGGTIAMTAAGAEGLQPALGPADLLAGLPGLAERAHVQPVALAGRPSASLTFPDLLSAGLTAQAAIAAGTAGAVLVQGTDTLEETAYLLDLYWPHDAPLVVTGAMRAPQQPGADGPANLLAAVTVAGSAVARGLGVLAVLGDHVHLARWVTKADSAAPDAFRSPSFGPIGRLVEGRLHLMGRAPRLPPVASPVDLSVRVGVLEATLGDSQLALLAGVDGAALSGLVVAGAGAGHVPDGAVPALTALAARMPVVLTSRTGGGPGLRSTYGFAGSERDLLDRGLLSGGWLPARKARLLLWALLAARLPPAILTAQLAAHAGLPAG